MSYEKLTKFVLYMRAMQEADLDVVSITSAWKGFGKSSLNIQVVRKYMEIFGLSCLDCEHEWVYNEPVLRSTNYEHMHAPENLRQPCPKCKSNNVTRSPELNFMRYLGYDNDEIQDMIHDLPPYSPILPDEGVRFMMAEDWNKAESKQMKKLFAQMRTKHMLVTTNIQQFRWTDRKYRNGMATFWIRILQRGLAVLLQPDLGERDDPWHLKEFEQLLGSYFYFTNKNKLIDKAELLRRKHPCVFDYFFVPKVPERLYSKYLEARDKKAFERKRYADINDKQLGKIACYNLINHWDEIKEEAEAGRLQRPTYQMCSNMILRNPQNRKRIVSFSAVRDWVKDIEMRVPDDLRADSTS